MKIFFSTVHDRERLNKLLFFLSELLPARRQALTDTAADLSTGMTMEISGFLVLVCSVVFISE